MPNNMIKKTIFLLSIILVISSCKKNKLDGNAVIEGVVQHHSKIIPNASVFIKFNATDQPSTDTLVYDAKVRADKDGYFKFNVYKGSYYIYGFGNDYAIAAPYHVVGGQGVKTRSKEKVTITLFVSED